MLHINLFSHYFPHLSGKLDSKYKDDGLKQFQLVCSVSGNVVLYGLGFVVTSCWCVLWDTAQLLFT